MTLEEAITIKQKYQYILQDASLPELIEADNMSIEALKWIVFHRRISPDHVCKLLPGETKE